MKNYNTTITMKDGKKINIKVTEDQAKTNKNIQNYIFNLYNKNDIESIDVALWNEYTKKFYNERTYNSKLENLKEVRNRVEITYTFDSGESEKIRCYVGKSMGWIPCYLEIKKSNSSGGGGLLTSVISNIRIVA